MSSELISPAGRPADVAGTGFEGQEEERSRNEATSALIRVNNSEGMVTSKEGEGEDDASSVPEKAKDCEAKVEEYWNGVLQSVQALGKNYKFRKMDVPLARVKKIMKLDDEVKMVSQETPVVLGKACEFFITELSMRSWHATDTQKRRTMKTHDVVYGAKQSDQFDFLIDILPARSYISRRRTNKGVQHYSPPSMPAQNSSRFNPNTITSAGVDATKAASSGAAAAAAAASVSMAAAGTVPATSQMTEYWQQQQRFMQALQSGHMQNGLDPDMVQQLRMMYETAQSQWQQWQAASGSQPGA